MALVMFAGSRRRMAILFAACLAGAAAGLTDTGPARAQFFPFFGEPARPQRAPVQALSPGQVRAVLAREGARLVGTPRLRGSEIVAIGRDDYGDRKRFTLDAISGEVLDITVIARREERPSRAPDGDLAPPVEPLPPPDHGSRDTGISAEPLPEPTPDRGQAAVSPSAPVAGPAAGAPPASAPRKPPDPADAALSPIKPLKPAGAPKVEPLPQ
ncbi:hypothetical protein [Rhodoblastus sp.]|uniref:hypothetical protein n=1 Tax=Rhodoblastus sp. TaxID=1962975 RepID=UPI0035B02927